MGAALIGDEYYLDIGGVARYAFELNLRLPKTGVTVVVTNYERFDQTQKTLPASKSSYGRVRTEYFLLCWDK